MAFRLIKYQENRVDKLNKGAVRHFSHPAIGGAA